MRNKAFVLMLLTVLLLLIVMVSLFTGGTSIPGSEIIYALLHPHNSGIVHTLIWKMRVPRICIGIVVGAALSACGVIFQAILRNPLAEPYTLGVSGGRCAWCSIIHYVWYIRHLYGVFVFCRVFVKCFPGIWHCIDKGFFQYSDDPGRCYSEFPFFLCCDADIFAFKLKGCICCKCLAYG